MRRHAAGRSFLDVGCMWNVNGRICFVAEEAGATAVTGVDVMAPTAAFEAERKRRESGVRFVGGDLHEPATLEQAGEHDVVWCSGVLYHAPHPLLTLERLRAVTGERLLLATEVLPEVPGLRGACVFYPALGDAERRAFARVAGGPAVGLTTPFDPGRGYGNWYWGIAPSALDGMLHAAGFQTVETVRTSPFHLTAIARPA